MNHLKKIFVKHFKFLIFFHPNLMRSKKSVHFRCERIVIRDKKNKREIWISKNNFVYILDMIGSFEYYFGSAASFDYYQNGGLWKVVDFSTPRMQLVEGFTDFPIMSPSLVESYTTCQQYIDFSNLKQGDVVLDFGCYSGLTAIAFSKVVGDSGRVISLEPDLINHKYAIYNINLNKKYNSIDNIELFQMALASSDTVQFFSTEGSMGSSLTEVVGDYRGMSKLVECISLDSIVKKCSLDRVDFIKMDIEGAELAVIKSAESFFKKFKPRIIIEPHIVNGKLNAQEISDVLESYGYTCTTILQYGVELPLVTGYHN